MCMGFFTCSIERLTCVEEDNCGDKISGHNFFSHLSFTISQLLPSKLFDDFDVEKDWVLTKYCDCDCTSGTDPLDMTAQVTNPAGRTVDAEIMDRPDCKYCVKFVPAMEGVHTVSVKNKGLHVPGT